MLLLELARGPADAGIAAAWSGPPGTSAASEAGDHGKLRHHGVALGAVGITGDSGPARRGAEMPPRMAKTRRLRSPFGHRMAAEPRECTVPSAGGRQSDGSRRAAPRHDPRGSGGPMENQREGGGV